MNKPRNCSNCGACCMAQNSPPMYLYAMRRPGEFPADDEDLGRVRALPDDAREALELYAAELANGGGREDKPCCWLDLETLRCRWYAHRPSICRDLDVGSEGCMVWRAEYNIGVEELLRLQ